MNTNKTVDTTYEDGEPVVVGEWVVRVGRPEDTEYTYIRKGFTSMAADERTTKDANDAYVFRTEKDAWWEANHWTWGHAFNRTGVVKCEPGYLNVIQAGFADEVFCIVVSCADFDAYKRLPAAVTFNETLLGKTGWNSDKNHAYYQSNAMLASIVR